MKKLLFCFAAFLLLPVLLYAQWDIQTAEQTYMHAPGDTFSVNVALSGTGGDIDALGLDFHFPEDILTFKEAVFEMTLLETWMFKNTSVLPPDTIRVAGFTTTGIISPPTMGNLVELKFEVKAGATGMGYFYLDGFTDDIATATTDSSMIQIDSGPAGLTVQPQSTNYEQPAGASFTIPVSISGVESDIDALGMDFHYPNSLLQFDGGDFAGTLLEAWMFKQVSELNTSTVRVAGFTTTGVISPPGTGTLLHLNFTVKPGVTTGEGQFYIDGFTDDLAAASTQSAAFKVGSGTPVMHDPGRTSLTFELYPNYPNPFNPETKIAYQIAERTSVVLEIRNLRGESIRTLLNAEQEAGSYNAQWDGKDYLGHEVSSGIYFYRIQTAKFNETGKMMLIR